MKNRGFTIVELLATIIILGIVSTIAVGVTNNILATVKKSSFKTTCENIYSLYDKYMGIVEKEKYKGKCIIYDFANTNEDIIEDEEKVTIPASKLNINGKLPTSGTYTICGDTVLFADNGEYTCYFTENSKSMLEGKTIENDVKAPIISNVNSLSDNNSITIVINAIEDDGLVSAYYYRLNENEYIESDNSFYKFNNLKMDTEYKIDVYVKNASDIESEVKTINVKTRKIDNTEYTINKYPNDTEYAQYKIIDVDYDDANNLYRYIKSSVDVITNIDIIGICGNNTNPSTCTNMNTKNLNKDYWYLVPSDIKVRYINDGTLYTYITDSYIDNSISTFNVSNIDNIKPNCTLTVSNNKVVFDTKEDTNLLTYGLSKDNTAIYNNTNELNIETGKYYGYVKDKANNINSCSLEITNTYVVNYKKQSKTCNETNNQTFELGNATTSVVSSCNKNNVNCNNGNVGNVNVTCTKNPTVEYTKEEKKCVANVTTSYSFGSETTKTDQTSCTENTFTCDKDHVNQVYTSCDKTYTVKTKTCKYYLLAYSFNSETTKTNQTSCTENTFTCNKSNKNKVYTTCTANYTVKTKTCNSSESTNGYSFNTPTTSTVSSCTNNKFECNSTNVNKTYVSCTEVDAGYTKEEKICTKKDNYTYNFSSVNEDIVDTCSNNTISCNKNTKNQTNIVCTPNEYKCANGVKINDSYCYIK